MTESWRGIFSILITPFTDELELDETGLRRQVDFCVDAGAAGVVGPANASEFSTLSDDERRHWISIVAEQTAGCVEYFRHLAGNLRVPVILQNYAAPLGTPMKAAAMARLLHEVDGIEYIKEEVPPEPRMISATLAAVGDACRGIFGGQGGIYLIDEFRRGAVGNMPGAHTTDILVDIWKRLEAEDLAGARSTFHRLLPLMVFERLYGVAIYKEVLQRRGIIGSTARRAPGPDIDADDRRELEPALQQVEDLFRV